MSKYLTIEIPEKQLEDLIRQTPDNIEPGLRYIDHQRFTNRGPLDLLMVDSGNALVVAELKVVEEDSMLVQGIDYYDYISRNLEGFARIYKDYYIDPKQSIRLVLIAPSFSISLINRCKWIDIPISLFTYKAIKLEGSNEIIPVFAETTIPSTPEILESYNLDDRLKYITDNDLRSKAKKLLNEIQDWDKSNILIEPTKYDISLKSSGRVFAYLSPRRQFYVIYTYDNEKKWTGYPIKDKNDLENAIQLMKMNIDRIK
ncbi:MAG: endonuclease NucS [Bacteroidales bacterium]|nr:endonuclease NucS [Bacteroidales bacterium]